MSTAALAVLEPQELNRTKGFLGTTGEMTAGADPEVLTHIKALSDVELFSLGEKALEDIADQILVLDEIRTRFRNAGGRAILGYASWREFVEKNSRYSIRTVQRRLSEIHGTDDTKVNRPETLAARRKEDHATNVASSDDAPQAPEPTEPEPAEHQTEKCAGRPGSFESLEDAVASRYPNARIISKSCWCALILDGTEAHEFYYFHCRKCDKLHVDKRQDHRNGISQGSDWRIVDDEAAEEYNRLYPQGLFPDAAAHFDKTPEPEPEQQFKPHDKLPHGECEITPKNIMDTRCLSMAQYRLSYCQQKVQVLASLQNEPEYAESITKALKIYRQAFLDFSVFCQAGVDFIDRNTHGKAA